MRKGIKVVAMLTALIDDDFIRYNQHETAQGRQLSAVLVLMGI
jgi:hypothetical protein